MDTGSEVGFGRNHRRRHQRALLDAQGTVSSFMGVRDVIKHRGLFASLYTDRGSHYWYTPEAGGKVAKENPTQFGMALQIPKDRHRIHYMKVKVRGHGYPDGNLAVFHGPRCLARYDAQGQSIPLQLQVVA